MVCLHLGVHVAVAGHHFAAEQRVAICQKLGDVAAGLAHQQDAGRYVVGVEVELEKAFAAARRPRRPGPRRPSPGGARRGCGS